jgi:DNA-binding transcriptional LysR family regulator
MSLNYVLCAAPSYLARYGVPRSPPDLHGHHCIAGTDTPASWRFRGPEGETEVPIYGRLQVNNAMLRRDAARAGAGILLCADYLVEQDFASGHLVRLLPEYKPGGDALHAVSPAYRATSPKVRNLVSHLAAQLGASV